MTITTVSTLTRQSVPRASKARYVLSSVDSVTITVPATYADREVSERAYVSKLWAEDWDSAEDAAYDAL